MPAEEYHTVARGAYFSREVIPNQLVVVSLNTMYFCKLMFGSSPVTCQFLTFSRNDNKMRTTRSSMDVLLLEQEILQIQAQLSLTGWLYSSVAGATVVCKSGLPDMYRLQHQAGMMDVRTMSVDLLVTHKAQSSPLTAIGLDRYTEISVAFQDTIVGQVFGHVNVSMLSEPLLPRLRLRKSLLTDIAGTGGCVQLP